MKNKYEVEKRKVPGKAGHETAHCRLNSDFGKILI